MPQISQSHCVPTILLAILLANLATASLVATAHGGPSHRAQLATTPRLDFSGRKRIGIASFYADRFAGRKMADGVRMSLYGNNAASRTLPLGTVAR